MRYENEKDYIMRMIKEMVRVLFSLMLGKHYVQVEPEIENKYTVSGTSLGEFKAIGGPGRSQRGGKYSAGHSGLQRQGSPGSGSPFLPVCGGKGR